MPEPLPRNTESKPESKSEARLVQQLQKWADGKATLKDVRGYSDEELYSIARTAYFFYYQGRINEARTLFQGLYAVNPLDAYFAKALGVVPPDDRLDEQLKYSVVWLLMCPLAPRTGPSSCCKSAAS